MLSRLEQETIILFNEQEQTAEVFTYNGRMRRELSALAETRPDEVKREGNETYIIPKRWVKIRASRILTDEQREEYARRAARTLNRQN